MKAIGLHGFHHGLGARFGEVNGMEVVAHYGDSPAEYAVLRRSAGVIDLSSRSRICLAGADRARFLHGQVTNDVKGLTAGRGCYAALVTAKAKMVSDLNVYNLQNALLLDFESGLAPTVSERLEKFIIADDVQVVDVAPDYGLLSVQGPEAEAVVRSLGWFNDIPGKPFDFAEIAIPAHGEMCLVNQPRIGSGGYDLFVQAPSLGAVADKLIAAATSAGGRACGWQALETARIEAGIPRFGADMDETTIPLEAGLETRAVSFTKGCYIGQEVISRIHTRGQVTKVLRGLRLTDDSKTLPVKGDKLFHAGKEVGSITSATASPMLKATIALGYVRKEVNQVGVELTLCKANSRCGATIVETPFAKLEAARGDSGQL